MEAWLAAFKDIAPYLTHPLVLVGFVLLLFFGLSLSARTGGKVVQIPLRHSFVVVLVVIVLGFALQFYKTQKEYERNPVTPSKNGTNDPTENAFRHDVDRDDPSSAVPSIEPFKQRGNEAQIVCAGKILVSLVPYVDPSARPARPDEFTHVAMRINGESDAKLVQLSEAVSLSDTCLLSGIRAFQYGPDEFGVEANVKQE